MLVDVLTQKKELFLAKLKEKSNFAALRDQDEWEFHDLLSLLTDDEDFKQICIDKAATESAGKSFKEDIDKCIELAEQGKKTASKYFKKGVKLQAYYTKINNADRVLNVNLIHYDKSEPTRISDILQQEKDIKELNIYCNKKHEIHAYREGKKRHYKFKEGADYEMTSTWPVKCTMIMNVSSNGITEILKFNDKDFVLSEEILELIKQNDELYIQGLSLYDAVLEKGKAMAPLDVIPAANNNLQNESIVAYQDKEPEEKLDPKVDADNSLPPPINSNALIQTEVNLQHTETQPEVASQHIGIQTEINSQQITDLQNELGRAKQTIVELEKQNSDLQSESEKAKQTIEKLERQNSDLRNRFEKEEQKNTRLQTELAQKDEESTSALAELREKVHELEVVNAEEKELKSELKESKKELNHVREENSNLEDKLDSLEQLNKKMNGNQEQLSKQVLDLQKELSCSEGAIQELTNKLKSAEVEKKEVNQELTEAEQRIEALEKQTSDLEDKLEKKERGSKAEIDEIRKEFKENLERNKKELKSVHEEKRKLEDKLKVVNAGKKESEDKLKEFEESIDQVVHIMEKKEQFISNLKRQMQGLENEHKAQQESYEQEISGLKWEVEELKNELKREKEAYKQYHSLLEKENEGGDELVEMLDKLSKIIGETVDKPCSNITEHLSRVETKELIVNKLTSMKHKLTGNVSNEPDNVPPKKRKLSRSLSVDSGFDNNEENCDDCSSVLVIKSVSPIEDRKEVTRLLSVRN